MKKKKLLILSFLVITIMSAMSQATNKDLQQFIDTIGNKYASDKRVEWFSIETDTIDNNTLILKGTTTNREAYNELISGAKKIHTAIEDSIRILPDEVIGTQKWGIVYNSVADVRKEPTFRSEMVTQVLMGMPLKILDKKGEWYAIQTPEGYIGWISGAIQRVSRDELNEYLALPKIIVSNLFAQSYSEPDNKSQPISDIVIGNLLAVKGEENNFFKVIYPDKREAYIYKEDANRTNNWLESIQLTGESIVKTAKQLMGIPYVWGGTSVKGLDCSGFTKIVYWLHGIIINRDASQQVKSGIEVDRTGNFDSVEKGDLVFFGTRANEGAPESVVHVGIYIGNRQFIHASDYIHISSFDENSEIYDAFNSKRYLRTMRYIGSEGSKGISPLSDHPFFSQEPN